MQNKYQRLISSISMAKIKGDRVMSNNYKKNGQIRRKNDGGDKHENYNYILHDFKIKEINGIQYLNV